MSALDTSTGGAPQAFPTTNWSQVLAAGDPGCPGNRVHLERLLRTYWKPVFSYIRCSWDKSLEDSKDLTQAFFAHVLESGVLSRMHPDRGSFRGYLKLTLKHFLVDAHRAEVVRRPAGGFLSLDDAAVADLEARDATASPDEEYDREWSRTVIEAAIEDLRVLLERDGKAVYFAVFRLYCLIPAEVEEVTQPPLAAPTYRSIATSLAIKESDVRNYLHYCRGALKELMRNRVREYVADDAGVEPEMKEILGQ